MGDGRQYNCSRDFAASVGLVPRQYSTGGRANLLGISKRGDKNLRDTAVILLLDLPGLSNVGSFARHSIR
jgi:hypothetical protein